MIVHIHLFRCAGTYLADGIKESFSEDEIVSVRNEVPQITPRTKFVTGHGISWLTGQTICLLRDPIERTWSNYWYVRQQPTHHLNPIFSTYDLEEILGNPTLLKNDFNAGMFYLNNHQLRHLLNRRDSREKLTDKDFEIVKQKIAAMSFVGRSDQVETYWPILCRLFDLKCPSQEMNKNTASKPEMPKSTRELIERNNSFDLELWDYANENLIS